jgi:nicotinate-nucleotide adenylyltransferase
MVQTPESKQKIGLLGGTFDPVHNGHLAVAKHVLHELGLDGVWFIPAALPPHKNSHADGHEITGFIHRHAMLELATAEDDHYLVSDIEAQRTESSYSIDTVNILIQKVGEHTDLFFIIGVDAFLEIDTWKQFKMLPDLVNFLIITRPTYSPDKIVEVIRQNFENYVYDPVNEIWSSRHGKGSFILQHMEPVPISSTTIRKKLNRGESIKGLVPQAVENYILKEKLYIK